MGKSIIAKGFKKLLILEKFPNLVTMFAIIVNTHRVELELQSE